MKLKLILLRLVIVGFFVFTALTAAGANEFQIETPNRLAERLLGC